MTKSAFRFMIIDDDPINNHICTKFLQIAAPGATVTTFTDPVEAVEHMRMWPAEPLQTETIVFLDINMPTLSGWDVLELFSTFPEQLKNQFRIYILSSSVADDDKLKASADAHVMGYIEKPMSIDRIMQVVDTLSAAA